jgi:hypothetical protein
MWQRLDKHHDEIKLSRQSSEREVHVAVTVDDFDVRVAYEALLVNLRVYAYMYVRMYLVEVT